MATLQEQLKELRAEETRLLNTPVSKRSKELLANIRSLIAAIENEDSHDNSCECGYCEKNEAAFAEELKVRDEHDEEVEDSAIESVYNKFSNTISMNKKVIAGLLIVTAIVITVVAVKMYKKASKAAE